MNQMEGCSGDVGGCVELPETETLVVVSKVKKLINEQAGLKTSKCFVDALTKRVVAECMAAVESAKRDGRKTVKGRDITG